MARTRLGRRWLELVGCINGLRLIGRIGRECAQAKMAFRVVTYSRHLSTVVPVSCLCRVLKVPLAAEMCEWPVTQPDPMTLGRFRRRLFCRRVVRFISGALPISHYIEGQLSCEARRSRVALKQLRIPILVDTEERCAESNKRPAEGDYVLFGGSAAYRKTIEFMLSALSVLTRHEPGLSLVMTGIDLSKTGWLAEAIGQRGLSGRVLCPGYIPREDLLAAYRQAKALLIPLFEDDQSRARFPTKFAEYLLSGRPVVTNQIGEITHYLEDGESAFLADPESPELFAEAVRKVLDHPEQAARVGERGRQIALKEFDYREHGRRLREWLEALS